MGRESRRHFNWRQQGGQQVLTLDEVLLFLLALAFLLDRLAAGQALFRNHRQRFLRLRAFGFAHV